MKIAIIGAGIIGLTQGITTAVRLLEVFPDSQITVYAEKFSPNLVSNVAAGWFKPNLKDGMSNEFIWKLSKKTYDRIIQESHSEDAYKLGVQLLSAFVLSNKEECEVPFWTEYTGQAQKLSSKDIAGVVSTEYWKNIISGYCFNSATVTTDKYLAYYMNLLEGKGVEFIQKKLTNLSMFVNDSKTDQFDYIINCCGLGAMELCNDFHMCPVRRQVLRVKAPWIKRCIFLDFDDVYILPLSDQVVLGGSKQVGESNTEPIEKEFQDIYKKCCQLMPSLKDAEIVNKQVGLRPKRAGGVRLEMEYFLKGNKVSKVIHNYGHSSQGIILSWGSADEVCEIIEKDQQLNEVEYVTSL